MPVAPGEHTPTDLESIANDLAALKQDFATLIADLRAGTVGRAKTAAHDAAEQLGDRAANLYSQAAAQAEKGARVLAQEIDERPLTTLLVAFAVGFVASRLLSR